MVDKIKLENFKCFQYIELNLKGLNLFTGLNGTGKSTIIHAQLLLRQSHIQGYLPENVCLNGDYVQLGTGQDVLYELAERDTDFKQDVIGIDLLEENEASSTKLKYDKDADILEVIPINGGYSATPFAITGDFEYLNAKRISPQTIYPKSSFHVDKMQQLGNNGQYTVHYLSNYAGDHTPWDSCDDKNKTLGEALWHWLNEISPNVRVDIQDIDKTDLSKIGYYYFDERIEKSNIFRPTNVGFGVSYVLPVIVALLKAKVGSTLIIENPEAHLHPKGQRKMGELISRCAASGVQVFIETHSDHILNGIRIATKNSLISSDNIGIFFFEKIFGAKRWEHIVKRIKINSQGKLDYWPNNFFDEWEKALDEII
jgi:predicted ATPase